MKLTLEYAYKSLDPFSIKLPDFTVLTGINGAGKTHLLQGIYGKFIKVNGKENNSIKLIPSYSLLPIQEAIYEKRSFGYPVKKLIDSFNRYKYEKSIRSDVRLDQFLESHFLVETIKNIADKLNKPDYELTESQILSHFPHNPSFERLVTATDLFIQDFSGLFRIYYTKLEENQYKNYIREKTGDNSITALTDKEFESFYGETPWTLFNKILEQANFGFHAKIPVSLHRDASFDFTLINNKTQQEVKFDDLSTGEKVIMSLLFAIYNSNYLDKYPDILLLDEPDASLHPSMTKQFLEVVENVFVKEKGIKVIMTTHSPSTVALAPEDSLFVIEKIGDRRIKKTKKDIALKLLTEGVPSLSINYENRRQVFVESENDVIFYEKFYEKLRPHLIPEISINFISSGTGNSGNCEQVKKIVNQLSKKFGNKYIFGIIDWDRKNNGNDFVKVLGKGERYSIENYIFDPVLIAAYLLSEKHINRKDLNLFNNETYVDFRNLSESQLQIISKHITNKVCSLIDPAITIQKKVRYLNGIEIEVPEWYLIQQGHSLEKYLKSAFKPLKIFQKEGELKKEIIKKVVDDIPELIPIDILRLFQSIQSN